MISKKVYPLITFQELKEELKKLIVKHNNDIDVICDAVYNKWGIHKNTIRKYIEFYGGNINKEFNILDTFLL